MAPSSRVTIWHNPRCSKSREALTALEARGVDVDVVRYLDTPPDAEQLRAVLDALGTSARGLVRKKEALYEELGLDAADTTDEALFEAMLEHPRLIERPVVIVGDRAVIARPTERIDEVL